MICMELTRTNAVFSRTTVVCFFVQKWKFSKHRKTFCGFFMDQKTTNGPEQHLGVPRGGHNPPGRAWAPRRAPVSCAHLGDLPHPLFAL